MVSLLPSTAVCPVCRTSPWSPGPEHSLRVDPPVAWGLCPLLPADLHPAAFVRPPARASPWARTPSTWVSPARAAVHVGVNSFSGMSSPDAPDGLGVTGRDAWPCHPVIRVTWGKANETKPKHAGRHLATLPGASARGVSPCRRVSPPRTSARLLVSTGSSLRAALWAVLSSAVFSWPSDRLAVGVASTGPGARRAGGPATHRASGEALCVLR